MTSIGTSLRAAREQRGVTLSEAAAATRIKYQIIDDLEHDNYRRTYAPVYAKGFIKIYGEYLGLDIGALLEIFERQQAVPNDQSDRDSETRSSPQPQPPKHKTRRPMARPLRSSVLMLRKSAPGEWLQRFRSTCRRLWRAWWPTVKKRAGSAIRSTALWTARTRDALHGRYRFQATAVIVVAIFALVILIAGRSVRHRRLTLDGKEAAGLSEPAPDSKPARGSVEFTHDPPPPYY